MRTLSLLMLAIATVIALITARRKTGAQAPAPAPAGDDGLAEALADLARSEFGPLLHSQRERDLIIADCLLAQRRMALMMDDTRMKDRLHSTDQSATSSRHSSARAELARLEARLLLAITVMADASTRERLAERLEAYVLPDRKGEDYVFIQVLAGANPGYEKYTG